MKQTPLTRASEKSFPNKKRSQSQGKYLQPMDAQTGGILLGEVHSQFEQRQKTQNISKGNNQMKQHSQQHHLHRRNPLHSPDVPSPKEQKLARNFDQQSSTNSRKNQKDKKILPVQIPQQSHLESAFETPKFSFGNLTALGSQLASNNNSSICGNSSPRGNDNGADGQFQDGHFSFGKIIASHEEVCNNSCLPNMNRQSNLNKELDSKKKNIKNNCFTQISSFLDEKTKEIPPFPNKTPILKQKTANYHNNLLKNIKQQQQQSTQITSKPTYNFYNFLDKENIFQLPFPEDLSKQQKYIPKKLPKSLESQTKHVPIRGHGHPEIQRLNKNSNKFQDDRNSYCTEVNARQKSAQRRSFDGLFKTENVLLSAIQPSSLNQTFDSSESRIKISKDMKIKTLRTPAPRQPQTLLSHNPRITTLF